MMEKSARRSRPRSSRRKNPSRQSRPTPSRLKRSQPKPPALPLSRAAAFSGRARKACGQGCDGAPTPAAPSATPIDTAAAPATAEDHRDANDLARAAIERLRGNDKTQEANKEAARTVDTPRAQEAPRTVAPPATASVRPLPPPITVAAPPVEVPASSPPYTAAIRNDDPNRPTPPAEIPPPTPGRSAGRCVKACDAHDQRGSGRAVGGQVDVPLRAAEQ